MFIGCVGICSFGMFSAPGTSHSITPTSPVKLAELSDMEQSAYNSTSSAIISASYQTGGDIKKVKMISEELSVYSSSISKCLNY